ncbi:lung seven transmembrane receptor [Holotrichia oblita]|uniref:Lung seven transmembrane receptor n=2 Tax=Holotrichia oblita TaxID=644536 RepID=A0ACB9TVK0_HOLOL|nr:lung seven transmembrane receptor [Holotrichia oblita]KAI4470886.1 lung seven transmembrane receptor [Holotrichia oblita]
MSKYFKAILLFLLMIAICSGRKHKININWDVRKYIALSTFGFYKRGFLDVKLINFTAKPMNKSDVFGFSLDRTQNDAMNPYLDSHQEKCLLKENVPKEHDAAVIYFILNFYNNTMMVNCSPGWRQPLHIYKDSNDIPNSFFKTRSYEENKLIRVIRDASSPSPQSCLHSLPLISKTISNVTYYNTSFVIYVASDSEEGLYNLYFHSCPNYVTNNEVEYDFTMEIVEENAGSFLSAGEMPLPALYCTMAMLFFLSGCFWVFLLKQSRHPVFKIHYLMATLVFIKSISLAFHGINYHFIEIKGVHLATWAVLFYVAHLLKGALLFITLVLIGTGWTFIKHVLAPRDKRLFMAIIPLQVLANMAEIILEESEEGAREYRAWQDVFILVDLLCCGFILFPVVWSIRHLEEASRTDGKAAVNLRKLKLFRHFYVMIVCYIYFTRIIVYLLRLTVPFQYGWLHEMFREMATYVFFVLTGYKFRPAAHNPYFTLPSDDEDEEDEVLTENGATEGLTRVNTRSKSKVGQFITEVTEEEGDALLTKKENSHEYD